MKRVFRIATGVVASAALMAGTAMATDYTVNMCGASAQAGFWQKSGASVLEGYGCTAARTAEEGDFYVLEGTGCTADSSGTNDDIVYVRYRSVNSTYGCENYDNTEATATSGWPVASECSFDSGDCASASTEDAMCMLGCADVPCDTFNASTDGWEKGFKNWVDDYNTYDEETGAYVDPEDVRDSYTATAVETGDAERVQGVIVPFGFAANNNVTQTVCNYDGVAEGAKLAYDKTGWSCDNTTTDVDEASGLVEGLAACLGNYKCIDSVCADGIGGTACEDASDCTMGVDIADSVTVSCDEEPLKNISRLMALHIFSGAVDNWSDFGPSFQDMPIVQCMRHAGSGTHQTLIDTVFRGDMNVASTSSVTMNFLDENYYVDDDLVAASGPHILHYKSSSDLTRDCIARFDGGIGYVDADKAMFTNIDEKTYDADGDGEATDPLSNGAGIHQLMYQGSAPNRDSVANGMYNFWAAQTCYYNPNLSTTQKTILSAIMDEASDAEYLTYGSFGERTYYWATQGEMQVEKEDSDPANYPKSVRE